MKYLIKDTTREEREQIIKLGVDDHRDQDQ